MKTGLLKGKHLLLATIAIIMLAGTAGAVILTSNIIKSSSGVVDFEVEVLTNDGSRPFRISELRGKIVILEFTYVGCAGCEYLHKTGYMQELYERYGDKVEIVTIFLYYPYDDLSYVKRYKEEYGINWRYVAVDRSGDLIMRLKLPALFTHVFLDEEGYERFRKVGNINFVRDGFPKVIELMLRKDYDGLKEFSDSIEGL